VIEVWNSKGRRVAVSALAILIAGAVRCTAQQSRDSDCIQSSTVEWSIKSPKQK
jgi:hypothetical protein